MKKIFILILFFSGFSYANIQEGLPISYYHEITQKKITNIKEIYSIPRYISIYSKYKKMPTEHDLNIIGSKYNIPNGLLYAMFWKESQFSCNKKSHKNAYGCFQFLYGTAKKMKIVGDNFDFRNNPWISADAAARYLYWNFNFLGLKNYNNIENWKYAVAAYNAGPNKVKTKNGLKIPLYTETQYYVDDIIGYVKGRKHIVKHGDLMHNISDKYSIHENTLKIINGNINNSTLMKGDFINIKEPIKIYKYRIKSGDNILSISSVTGIDPSTIGKTNKLHSLRNIKIGDTIYLPIY